MEEKQLRKLWAAVLERAILDLNISTTSGASLDAKNNACWWFRRDSYEFNQFLGICRFLGLDAQSIRKKYHNKIYCKYIIERNAVVRIPL